MKHRQRVTAAIKHQQPDRIPLGELVVPDQLVAKVMGNTATGERERLKAKRAFLERLDMDLVVVDETWNPVERASAETGMLSEVRFWAEESDLFVFVLFTGGFTGALNQMGWRELMITIARAPDELGPVIRGMHDYIEKAGCQCLRAGAHGIIIGDDIAHKQGLFASPEVLRTVLFPSLAETVGRLKEIGDHPVLFHSEGNINLVLDDIVDMGFDGLHSLEPGSKMDLRQIKDKYGDKLCLMGNLELQYLLPKSEGLEREVTRILETAGSNGGFIFSTTGGLVEEVDPGQLEKMCMLVTSHKFPGER